jgi:hypothetical protein
MMGISEMTESAVRGTRRRDGLEQKRKSKRHGGPSHEVIIGNARTFGATGRRYERIMLALLIFGLPTRAALILQFNMDFGRRYNRQFAAVRNREYRTDDQCQQCNHALWLEGAV